MTYELGTEYESVMVTLDEVFDPDTQEMRPGHDFIEVDGLWYELRPRLMVPADVTPLPTVEEAPPAGSEGSPAPAITPAPAPPSPAIPTPAPEPEPMPAVEQVDPIAIVEKLITYNTLPPVAPGPPRLDTAEMIVPPDDERPAYIQPLDVVAPGPPRDEVPVVVISKAPLDEDYRLPLDDGTGGDGGGDGGGGDGGGDGGGGGGGDPTPPPAPEPSPAPAIPAPGAFDVRAAAIPVVLLGSLFFALQEGK